jgi:hypothetical protein
MDEKDKILSKMIKDSGLESPQSDISDNVISYILTCEKKRKSKFIFLIPKIAVIFYLLAITVIIVTAAGQNSSSGYFSSLTSKFVAITSNIFISNNFNLLALVLVSMFMILLLDYLLRKKI